MLKAILFDLDGTLVNTNQLIFNSFQKAFKELLKENTLSNEEIINCIGPTLEQTGEKYYPQDPNAFVEYYRHYYQMNHDDMIEIFPGIIEMLENLKQLQLKLVIVTSKKRDMTIKALKYLNIYDYFDLIVSSDDVRCPKPHPEHKASPEEVRVMLIDPKRVELAPYNAIPHLITPVISDERKAAQGLKWAVDEMERRYELFATNGVRDIKSFNERRHEFEMSYAKLPYILIVIDELADLMMVSAQEVEDCIMRITQKARAAGIHLIVATQRPTVDVITGTIKSNIPSRIAFAVAQANDSRVILDENGAQNLLGKGDMLWSSSGSKVKRVQGAYISTDEIDAIVDFVKKQGKPKYLISDEIFQKGNTSFQSDTDPLLYDAMNFIFDRGYATVSSLQTRLRIGFNRAARIIETLEMSGWIGEPQGAQKQREIKISREEFEAIKDETRF